MAVLGKSADTREKVAIVPTLGQSELRYLVLAAQREGNRALSRQLRSLGLTTSQSEIVLVLGEFGPITLKGLGELIVCETGSPSRIVDALVNRGVVSRVQSQEDRRAVLLELSESGLDLARQLQRVDLALDSYFTKQVNSSELRGLVSALRAFLEGTESSVVLQRRFEKKRRPV